MIRIGGWHKCSEIMPRDGARCIVLGVAREHALMMREAPMLVAFAQYHNRAWIFIGDAIIVRRWCAISGVGAL